MAYSPTREAGLLGLVGLLLFPAAAAAHLEFASGRLLGLAQRADAVILARVSRREPAADGRRVVAIDAVRGATHVPSRLTAPGRMALVDGQTYVFFIDAERPQANVLQPEGTVIDATGDEDATLASIERLRAALRIGDAAVPGALIDTLQASNESLRWHAALALLDWSHPGHALSEAERTRLAGVLAAPSFDPGLRGLLDPLTRSGTPAPAR